MEFKELQKADLIEIRGSLYKVSRVTQIVLLIYDYETRQSFNYDQAFHDQMIEHGTFKYLGNLNKDKALKLLYR